MRIKVIDAFGTHRGNATVEWLPADYSLADLDGPDEEAKLIFEPSQVVTLPTKNANVPWRLEIEV